MNEDKPNDDQEQLNSSGAEGEQSVEPKKTNIQLGGVSTTYSADGYDELADNGLPQQQTTVVGLHGREDGEKQVEVIAPQYQQEKKAKPTQYTSASQSTIDKDLRKRGPAGLIIFFAILMILAAVGYVYYLLNS